MVTSEKVTFKWVQEVSLVNVGGWGVFCAEGTPVKRPILLCV